MIGQTDTGPKTVSQNRSPASTVGTSIRSQNIVPRHCTAILGSDPTRWAFRMALERYGMTPSICRGIDVWDNASMNNFLEAPRTGRTNRRERRDRDDALRDRVIDRAEACKSGACTHRLANGHMSRTACCCELRWLAVHPSA